MNVFLFLAMRVAHVLLAALWIGSSVVTIFFLDPAVTASGAAGSQVMSAVNRRGLGQFFGIIAGTTILTGIYLYWRFTGGFDPEVSRSHGGLAFGIGGIAGLFAGIIGGSVIGRATTALDTQAARLVTLADGKEHSALLRDMRATQQRVAAAGRLVIALQVIALSLMAIGHYI
jgi:uncharacterized membrane protein